MALGQALETANVSGRTGQSTRRFGRLLRLYPKNEHSAHKRQGRNACSALKSLPKVDQVSDSTNTSSRFLRNDGSSASTSRKAAIAISTAESGRGRDTLQSPREISSARRRFSSISGPSTMP